MIRGLLRDEGSFPPVGSIQALETPSPDSSAWGYPTSVLETRGKAPLYLNSKQGVDEMLIEGLPQ